MAGRKTSEGLDARPVDLPRRGTEGFRDDLKRQLSLMAHRAAPYRRLVPQLLQLLDDPADGARLCERMNNAWKKREFRAYYERPLLLFAALRAEALADGPSHPLHAALRDMKPNADAMTPATLRSALDGTRTGLWTTLALRRVQTNDTSRALAWLWPAAIAGCSDGARPLVLVDVGCSAGLNLIADALPPMWTTKSGAPLAVVRRPQVLRRIGVDERPLYVERDHDARWLHACIWPGETDRLERFNMAVATLRNAPQSRRIELVRRDATVTPALVRPAIAAAPPNTLTIVYQTMVSGYLDAQSRDAFEGGLHELVVSSPTGSVLWVDLEVTGPATSPRPAELQVHARVGDQRETFVIGATGYHPTEVHVRKEAVAALTELLRRSTHHGAGRA
jgi:hypothetical protein